MYKAHIRKALGTFQELQKPGKPHPSQPAGGGASPQQPSGKAGLGRGETFLRDCLLCPLLSRLLSLIHFSLAPASWCSPGTGWSPPPHPHPPHPPIPLLSCFLGILAVLAVLAVFTRRGSHRSPSLKNYPLPPTSSHTHTLPHLLSSVESCEQGRRIQGGCGAQHSASGRVAHQVRLPPWPFAAGICLFPVWLRSLTGGHSQSQPRE